jgi:outer membrane protein
MFENELSNIASPMPRESAIAGAINAAQDMIVMHKVSAAMALLASFGFAASAQAAEAGDVQVKLLGTAVLADGKITDVTNNALGVSANTQTEANDNYVPTLAIEYFFSSNVSVETICCLTQHDVDAVAGSIGATSLVGAELVADAKILPATVTLKYHFATEGVKPYVGVGPTYFIFIDEKPGAAAVGLGADGFRLNDSFGVALQAGVDVPIGNNAALTLDAKKYFLSTSAHWFVGSTEVLATDHKLDPWVLSAGVGFTL